MTDVETGYKAVAFIKNAESSIVATMPSLGTNVNEPSATGPTAAAWANIVGITSIGLPEDNSPIDIPELGTRIIQRVAGALSISSRIEKWKKDSQWLGAVTGLAAYAAGPVTTYSKGDALLKYDVLVYTGVPVAGREAVAGKGGSTGYADEAAIEAVTGFDYEEKILLSNVQLNSYDTTKEPNAGIKETIPYTAEQATVTRK